METSILPHLTAALDALSLVFLLIGYAFIRSGQPGLHKKAMIAAVITAALFLVFYLIHHFSTPLFAFRGPDDVKPWYFAFLFSHVTLAALIVPFVVITLKRAISGNFEGHKRIAKKLFPIWVYVAVTGVIVYLFLYQIYPPLADGAVQ
jgi:uncharacterized membrane protein YozB (DUF420 family)